jgi:ribosomal protein S18 acetylase RimI-like enzyme
MVNRREGELNFSMELSFKRVYTNEDIGKVARLAKEIWHEYYVSILSRAQIEYMVEKYQSVAAIRGQIEQEGFEYYLMEKKNGILSADYIGYMGVKPDQGKLFLSKFYIQKEHRGKGYASQALAYLQHICQKRNLDAIWLTVNRYNERSIAIYKKKGFQIVREQVADIGNGFVMDDYVMELQLML